jgi:hypothetical protein
LSDASCHSPGTSISSQPSILYPSLKNVAGRSRGHRDQWNFHVPFNDRQQANARVPSLLWSCIGNCTNVAWAGSLFHPVTLGSSHSAFGRADARDMNILLSDLRPYVKKSLLSNSHKLRKKYDLLRLRVKVDHAEHRKAAG